MLLTDSDRALLDHSRRILAMGVSYLVVPNGPAKDILAIRYYLGCVAFGRYSVSEDSYKNLHLLLCKLRTLYPEQANDYLISIDWSSWMQDTRIASLADTYSNRARQNGGWGSWTIPQHESVVFAITNRRFRDGAADRPDIIPVRDLRSLLTAYSAQAAATKVAPIEMDAPSVRARMAETTADEGSRRRGALDVKGKCYWCSAPKPRKIRCTVCGYAPSAS